MGQLLLFVVVALVVAAIVFGVTVMVSGGDPGLTPVEPDGKALPLPNDRPLGEDDVFRARFDTAFRGYRMAQVDQALQRAAYDIGYKSELIGVLEAEVAALREGRTADADVLRRAREAAVAPAGGPGTGSAAEPGAVPAPDALVAGAPGDSDAPSAEGDESVKAERETDEVAPGGAGEAAPAPPEAGSAISTPEPATAPREAASKRSASAKPQDTPPPQTSPAQAEPTTGNAAAERR
ncbi:DivIVA domain-containing protein [Actinoplanes sp. TFC3]|uniref:DivIVA domain-containing protein n=1 Tax=Actinoplanes sp. TFC3 TaxID=1710355 RepID=UPI00082D1CEC|nr:DivIVA domain-containing protein [Actinoplanes sp. TFC3]